MSRVYTITLNPAIDHTVTVEHIVPGAVHRARGQQLEAGGKGVGVASVLAALGVPVTASGWLGADNDRLFVQTFAARGIADGMVRVPGSTRTNIKLADLQRGDTTDINLPGVTLTGPALADARQALAGRLEADVQSGDWCELAGSLPPGADAGVWLDLAQRLQQRGAHLVVDVAGATLRAVLDGWAAQVSATQGPALIKPNRAELEELLGRELPDAASLAAAADALRARGVQRVVVSLGGEGALIAGPEGRWLAQPPRVPVATTVGAGDALVGGAIAALRDGLAFPDAAVFGMACAAARIQRIEPTLPPVADVRALAAQVVLTPL
ncbi:MAG: Tagatose-6-phosphate kinase [Paracidovorax wautersii]|uniref:Phosphofructokinase n=1 Tax=Paracidovorax wautersii TaxID=1177982 RepID=A0A7V8JQN7_9BURK|nr:MAG: Tagatose-6-phosphate kinase [Paracidovorax wautersii]